MNQLEIILNFIVNHPLLYTILGVLAGGLYQRHFITFSEEEKQYYQTYFYLLNNK